MSSPLLIGLELALVFGCVLGFGIFELMSLRKGKRGASDRVKPDDPPRTDDDSSS